MTRRPNLLHVVLCVVTAGIVYLPTLRGELVWDDQAFVGRWVGMNLSISDALLPRDELVNMAYYRPFGMGSGALIFRAVGASPVGWHLSMLLVHMATVGLLWHFLRRDVLPSVSRDESARRWGATAGALFFAVWPANAENVAFVSARCDTLLSAMLLGAVMLHLRADRRSGRPFLAAAIFFLALLTKETAIVFLPLLLCSQLVLGAPRTWRGHGAARLWLPYLLAYLAYATLRKLAFRTDGNGLGSVAAHLVASTDSGLVVRAWGFYVREALGLGASPPFLVAPPSGLPVYGFALLGTLVILASVLAWRRREHRPWALAAAWFGVPLGPPLAVVSAPLSQNAVTMHYLYLPMLGLATAVALGAALLAPRARGWILLRTSRTALAACGALALVVAVGVEANRRARPWLTGVGLWERALQDNPLDCLCLHNLAGVTPPGEEQMNRLRVTAFLCVGPPDIRASAFSSLAIRYIDERDWLAARASLRAARSSADMNPMTAAEILASSTWVDLLERQDLGGSNARVARLRARTALGEFEAAVTLDPFNPNLRIAVAAIYEALQERVRARVHYRFVERTATSASGPVYPFAVAKRTALDSAIAAETDPFRRSFELAETFESEGKFAEATAAYRRALEIDPGRPEALTALADRLSLAGKPTEAAVLLDPETLTADAMAQPAVWLSLGMHRSDSGDRAGAEEAFAECANLAPAWPKLRLVRGANFELMGEKQRALAEYEAGLTAGPSLRDETALRRAAARVRASSLERVVLP